MLNKIQRLRPTLSKSEKAAADWIIAHPREALESTLAHIAVAAGISEPTVIRFCRSMGLQGFRALKLRLAETHSQPGNYLHRDLAADDSISDVVAKVLDSSIRALIDSRAQTSSMPFEDSIDAMTAARQLIFAGLGASGIVAADACQKFFRLGIPCSALTDSPGILQAAAIVDNRDVLIIISHTGSWPDILRAAQLAKANGAKVLAVTDPATPLAGLASLVFECPTTEDTNIYTPMSSRLAHLALLDALQVALALKLGRAADSNLRKSKDVLAARH